jgi:PAS domain S-box-containing protein
VFLNEVSGYIVIAILSLALLVISYYNYLLFHTIAEAFTIIVAFSVFIIVWNSRKVIDNNYLLLLGLAYPFVGIVLLLHALAYQGMDIFPLYGANLSTQLWIQSRYLLSISFLVACFTFGRKLNLKLVGTTYSAVTGLFLATTFFWRIFPISYVEGVGLTPFKVVSEYVISTIFAVSLVFFYRKKSLFEKSVWQLLFISIVLMIISELTFTLYVSVFGFFNMIGHILTVFAFFLVYKAVLERGIVRPYDLVFRSLKQSEERFRGISERSVDEIFEADLEGRFTYVSPAVQRIFGYEPEEVVGTFVQRYLPESEFPRVAEALAMLAKGQVIQEMQVDMLRKDGSRIPLEITAAPVIRDGVVVGIQGIGRDITRRKKLMDEIENTAKFPIQDPNPVMRFSRDKILFANRPSEPILRSLKAEVGGSPPRHFQDLVSEVLNNKSSKTFEYIFKDQIYSFLIVPIVEAGYVNLYGTNITERKRLEGLKDQFISAVTHELRTPLVSIKGYTDYLLSGKMGLLSPKVESSISVVKQASDRLLNLTNQLLDYRRLMMGKFELTKKPLDLKEIIANCAAEIQPFMQQKKQTLKFEIPKEPLTIQGDHARLTQVVMNLLSNASKFTPENGEITVRVAKKDGYIQFSVSDMGIGIKAEDLPRVFEPFSAIQKPSYIKGTGLGLSVSKGLIEAHGGRMWAESEGEGKGSAFTFTIPVSTEKNPNQHRC